DVADYARITRQSLARIERGNAAVSFDTALRIFDFLGITLNGTTQDPQLNPTANQRQLSPRQQKITIDESHWAKLDEAIRTGDPALWATHPLSSANSGEIRNRNDHD